MMNDNKSGQIIILRVLYESITTASNHQYLIAFLFNVNKLLR